MLTHFAELTHLAKLKAGKPGLARAVEAAEAYRNDPNCDNHDMMTRLVYAIAMGDPIPKHLRTNCKIIYLGLCYGMGGGKLARDLGLSTKWIWSKRWKKQIEVAGPEAQAILDKFNQKAPFIKQLAKECERVAKRRGYLVTLLGRRCRFPRDERGQVMWAHKGLNRIVQGSSGDQTKAAMVEADAAGFAIQLQVHDEIDQTVGTMREARELGVLMTECVPLRVPSKVDVEVGLSWGTAKEWKCDRLAEILLLGRRVNEPCIRSCYADATD